MTTKPLRIQLSRKAGWEKPPNTVVVSRPSRWGNPFRLGFHTIEVPKSPTGVHRRFANRSECVDWFRADVAKRPEFVAEIKDKLRGKNLACWCELCGQHRAGKPLGVTCAHCEKCHADVLLEIANA